MKNARINILFLACCFLFIKTAAAQDTAGNAKPFVLGSIEELQSKVLSEKRTLNIYLPEGYHQDDTTRYPVMYLLDGSADEDFIHIAGLVQFANFSWVNLLPKTIVVGIANIDRRRDFTFPTTIAADKKDYPTTGSSAKFIDFIEKELQPYIDKKYRTGPDKMLVGESLGGLLATEILFKKPELFNKYVIVSPSLWWDKESLLNVTPKILHTAGTGKTSVYIAVGKEGDVMENDAKRLSAILETGNKNMLQVGFGYFEKENHGTILHLAVYSAFEAFAAMNKK